ncbi:MAG: four helix bundle protein [Phycisphaerae bacterium]|nr:four helix bundle protein [Phycisphaerae bacterium]
MAGQSYRDLNVWKEAMDLVVACYRVTDVFPKKEMYGLGSQLQRAVVSVPSNIAEGQGRQYSKEFLQYIAVAYGSLAEAETHIQIARRLNYIDETTETHLLEKTGRIGRMLNGLRKSIQEKMKSG